MRRNDVGDRWVGGVAERDDWLTGGNRRALAVERITAAATELFVERGFDQVGVHDIAERAGCSRATLYRYVGGKPALVSAVVASAAAAVAEEVTRAVQHLVGPARVVEAILTAVAAVRADATLSDWFAHTRTAAADDYLASSPDLSRVATALTGTAEDEAGGQWIVRVVLTLLAWPAADTRMERQLVQRFVAPAFAT